MADKFPDPKVGDPVAYYNSHARGPRPSSRQTIERVTATQVIVQGARYKRSSGDEVGAERCYTSSIIPWDAALDERLAALDAEEANAQRAMDLFKRADAATYSLRVRKGGGTRVWKAVDLERLTALVQSFEDAAAVLLASLDA